MGKVRIEGIYSGQPPKGHKEWPMVLRGTKEIAAFLRWHPETVGKFLRSNRMPGCQDSRGTWYTTRSLIDKWILQQQKVGRYNGKIREDHRTVHEIKVPRLPESRVLKLLRDKAKIKT